MAKKAKTKKGIGITPTKPILLGALLLVIVILGILIAFYRHAADYALTPPPESPPHPKTTVVSLELSPRQSGFPSSEVLKIDVLIQDGVNIYGADLNLRFDPGILVFIEVAPGTFFPQPIEIKTTANLESGEIGYALGSLTSQSGKGVLASFFFKPQNNLTLPQTTYIALTDQTELTAKDAGSVKILLPLPGRYKILP